MTRALAAVTLASCALALQAASAQALNIGLSAAVPATFGTNLQPGQTINSTLGTVTVTSVLGLTGWTLQVKDSTNAGRMQAAAGATCTGSATQLANPLTIAASDPLGASSISVNPRQAVGSSNATIATYSATLTLLSTATLNTNLQQTIGASEVLKAGCLYSTTLTYTVQ